MTSSKTDKEISRESTLALNLTLLGSIVITWLFAALTFFVGSVAIRISDKPKMLVPMFMAVPLVMIIDSWTTSVFITALAWRQTQLIQKSLAILNGTLIFFAVDLYFYSPFTV